MLKEEYNKSRPRTECPNCGKLIYSEDWTDEETDNWTLCPICEEFFGEEE